jgi:hypothetical protein
LFLILKLKKYTCITSKVIYKGRSPSNGKLSDFPSILIAKNLLTGSLKNRSIDNLETQKESISMKNSQFFDYLTLCKIEINF